jgi:hypothetical protein
MKGLAESNPDSPTLTTQSWYPIHTISGAYHELTCDSDGNKDNWDPSDSQAFADVEVDWEKVKGRDEYDPKYDDENQKKWQYLRRAVIPEASFEDVDYAPTPENHLAVKFANSGLQVIVKMASIELTPDKPEFPSGEWHVSSNCLSKLCGRVELS